MTIQSRVFLRVIGLLSVLIISVCITAAVFSLRENRESYKSSFRAQALFLADQVERLVLWDDRVALKALLARFTDEQKVVSYAFVEKEGMPYVHTFERGVPSGLLNLHGQSFAVLSRKVWKDGANEVFYDIAASVERGEATLHLGLSRSEIDSRSYAKIWTIASLGLGALVIGMMLAGVTALVTTREVDEMTDALRLSEERVRLVLSSAAEGIFGIDLDGNCTFINPAGMRALGYDDDTGMIGKNMHDLVHHTNVNGTPCAREDCRIQNALKKGEYLHSDGEVFWKHDGSGFPVEFWCHPVLKNDKIVGGVITFVDITERVDASAERRLLEGRLFEARKMEALGQLAGGVAHDFNNLLSPIILITEILLDDLELDEADAAHLADVLAAARRAQRLVHQILSYSRPEEHEKRPMSLSDVMYDAMDLVRPGLPPTLSLKPVVENDTPLILGDFDEIHQVVMNLLKNAAHAMGDETGAVEIRVRRVIGDDKRRFGGGTLSRGDFVAVDGADPGFGMDDPTRGADS
ncbi:MAG: PAS domain S-box protein, partial [Alphaproteobacteria bacterium]|nr:PAS domain S-box protein [Alphaproteobacteria bacterium]